MKILFTCGGTAGHVNPAVAVARLFQERHPGCEVLFVGADGGMEQDLVPREGFPIRTVTITNFRRRLTPEGIRHNLVTLRNLTVSRGQARRILDEFPADLVVGTGGYASYPVVREAARRGARTVNGLGMLANQGALNFTLWTGQEAPVEVMEETLRREFGL